MHSEEKETEWVMLGTLDDRMTADMAQEMLQSENIPAVVISRSGMFGNIGLTLHDLYSGDARLFELSVPGHMVEDAADLLNATLGDHWKRRSR